MSDSAAEQQQQQDSDDEDGETAASAASQSVAARKKEKAAAHNPINCSAITFDGGNNNNRDCGGVLAATFDGSQVWALTFPTSNLSRGASLAAASTGDPSHRMSFALDVPDGMAVTDVLWTVSRVVDVGNSHSKSKIAAYNFGTNSTCRNNT